MGTSFHPVMALRKADGIHLRLAFIKGANALIGQGLEVRDVLLDDLKVRAQLNLLLKGSEPRTQ
jgi:hypothetical protein